MSQSALKIIQNIVSSSVLLPLVFYLLFQRNNKSRELRVILFYIIYSILNEAYGFYLHKIKDFAQYTILFDIFTVIEFCFFTYFFYLIIENKKVKKLLLPLAILFSILAITDHFFLTSTAFTIGLQPVLIISLCLYYFFDELKQPNSYLVTSINFWIIIAFLIYMAGTFFLYIMAENMTQDEAFMKQYFLINSIFNLLKNILLSVAMLMKPQRNENNNVDVFDTDLDIQSLKNQN